MSSWDILGGNGNGDNDDEEVEYVGVIEEDAPEVQEPMRSPRRNVRRVVPQQMPMDQPVYAMPRGYRNGVVGAPNRDEEDLVSYVNMPYGKQLGLTPEAIDRLQNTPMIQMNGQMSQRIEPGTYVMYGPSRADGLGELGQDKTASYGGGGYTGQPTYYEQPQQSGARGLVSDILGAAGTLGGVITGAVLRTQESRREAETARYIADLERDTESEARQYALQTAMLEQQTRIAEIEAGGEELEVLRQQAEAAAALRAAAPPTVVPSGTSPVVWILVALLGVGAVGGVIYTVSKKKDD